MKKNNFTKFPITPPEVKDKIWRVTIVERKLPVIKLKVHCNNVKVLDFTVDPNKCAINGDNGLNNWDRQITHIVFVRIDSDTASDAYRAYTPGMQLLVFGNQLTLCSYQ
jgi:hypothetical protein